MPCGSMSDQIVLKSPYMNRDLSLQLDDRNQFPFCNSLKNVGFQLKWSIAFIQYSTQSSFLSYIPLNKHGDARILNFLHFFSHLKKEWDSKESRITIEIFSWWKQKTNAHVSFMFKCFKHALISFCN